MNVLGIESATRTGGAAIIGAQGVIAEYTLNVEATHSERLMSTIDRVLADAGMTSGQLDGFAVSIGPGSFTGLRIGIAAVLGLCLTTGKPVAAVPTLKALAWNIQGTDHDICAALDAKKQEVYAAIYRQRNGGLEQRVPESMLSLNALAGAITERTLFTGEGALHLREEIASLLGDRAVFSSHRASMPSAASVAEIGRMMLMNGAATDPETLVPLYLRRPEAEIAWEKRHRSR